MTAKQGEGQGVEGSSKEKKGLMDMDQNVVIAGQRDVRELIGNGKIQ